MLDLERLKEGKDDVEKVTLFIKDLYNEAIHGVIDLKEFRFYIDEYSKIVSIDIRCLVAIKRAELARQGIFFSNEASFR